MTRKLRLIRESKGMSRSALSKETGVNSCTIWKYETGKSEMLKPLLKKLATYFEVTIEELAIEVAEDKIEQLKVKSCLNQRCLLNKEKYCQSDQICNGAFCKNENEVIEPVKEVKYNLTSSLFV